MRRLSDCRRRNKLLLAATLLETSFAMAVLAVFLTGVVAMNSRIHALVMATKDSGQAQQAVRDRIEKIRSATWENLTSAEYLRDTVLNSNGNVFPPLRGATITVGVTAFPPGKSPAASPILVERTASGTVAVQHAGDGTMNTEDSIRLEVTARWPSGRGMTRTRQSFTIISKNGIAGRRR